MSDPYGEELLVRLIDDLDDALAAHDEGDGPGLVWRLAGVRLQLRWLLDQVRGISIG